MDPIIVAAIVGVAAVVLLGLLITVARFYRQVDQGKALVINTMKSEPVVTFTGAVVFPIVNRVETMDISLKTIELDRRGKEGLICRDNIRADIKVTFFVRVNKTKEDVLKVAQAIGCARASDPKTLEELFVAKFSEALKTAGKRLDFEDLYKERDSFKDQIVDVIGKDLNGYMLEDAAIDYLEQTPIELLDKDNILDAQGIKKITELTTVQNVMTNDFRQTERMAITKRNVEAQEAILSLERQQAEAQIRQQREIDTMTAREAAETAKIQAEEKARAELARIQAEEQIQINEQNKLRQIEVAQKNRERVIAIETERVHKDAGLEAINREREVELLRIEKEKQLEVERKAIADVVRGRIAVDKTVAEEEERIKDLRLLAEAKRQKDAAIVHAEAQAQEALVKEIKAAEAAQQVATFHAKERLTLAEASLEAADKEAKAKIRLAEGVQAETAAPGLAQVRVREADAAALEKQGMAQVRVKEAEAGAIEKQGFANAVAIKEKLLAEAAGEQEKGLAGARVREAEAGAVQALGEAEAVALKEKLFAEAAAIQEKLSAEARGLKEKAESMKLLDGVGKDHEEFRLKLDKEKQVELAAITVKRDVAAEQAKVMAEAFGNAKIQIVGGDGEFFDKLVKAMSFGQSMDAAVDGSHTLKTALKDYLDGDRSLPADLKEILSRPGLTGDAQNVALAALLAKVAQGQGALPAAPNVVPEKPKSR